MSKKKRKDKKKLLKILKEYSGVITIVISLLAVVSNGVITYFNKANSTSFNFEYLSLKIDNEKWFENYLSDSYGVGFKKSIQAPTINNEINKLIYKEKNSVIGYYVTYLIISQNSGVDAQDIKINFEKYGSNVDEANLDLSKYPISQNKKTLYTEKIGYPFKKGEKIKVPISLCKITSDFTRGHNDCYYMLYKPISIEYKNKYLFSKKTLKIRKYTAYNVIVDGECITGRGGDGIDSLEIK